MDSSQLIHQIHDSIYHCIDSRLSVRLFALLFARLFRCYALRNSIRAKKSQTPCIIHRSDLYRTKIAILSFALKFQLQHLVERCLCVFSLQIWLWSWKTGTKTATLTEINSFFSFGLCVFACSFLAHQSRIDCAAQRGVVHVSIATRKCISRNAYEKKTNMIYGSQKCDNKNSCIDVTHNEIRIGIFYVEQLPLFCNQNTFIAAVLLQGAGWLESESFGVISHWVMSFCFVIYIFHRAFSLLFSLPSYNCAALNFANKIISFRKEKKFN